MRSTASRRQVLAHLAALTASVISADSKARTPAIHRVTIVAAAFDPAELEIQAGDSVEWLNQDIVPHTATEVREAWSTGLLERGDVHTEHFTEAGTVDYYCRLHPSMRARITVRG